MPLTMSISAFDNDVVSITQIAGLEPNRVHPFGIAEFRKYVTREEASNEAGGVRVLQTDAAPARRVRA
ncbi:hypothetical protein [Microbacterium halotolerans]|uniref:hypothetical protein n=1 Tax=Microbacterium halotolerans TaxID=246613 RepID=UPI000E6AB998|nr:hypothetical protein [Microbacterium halotolerans]